MSLVISSVFTYDTDAGNYIQAVETADGQALESATRKAINDFVIGCKQDGIWDAIKASCILSGARTLAGALVPLVGTAPTNYNFVAGDYNRKTGLVGNGSTKYLDSNRLQNASPQNDIHASVYVSTSDTRWNTTSLGIYIGSRNTSETCRVGIGPYNSVFYFSANAGATAAGGNANQTGFISVSRSSGTQFTGRRGGASTVFTVNSLAPSAVNIAVFANNKEGTIDAYSNARLAFYSIGESLDLAKLDGRVTDLINKFSQVIP